MVVTNVCSGDEDVVFCFSMLECPLMVVERCVTENSTEQSEEKAGKKELLEITYKSYKTPKE